MVVVQRAQCSVWATDSWPLMTQVEASWRRRSPLRLGGARHLMRLMADDDSVHSHSHAINNSPSSYSTPPPHHHHV